MKLSGTGAVVLALWPLLGARGVIGTAANDSGLVQELGPISNRA